MADKHERPMLEFQQFAPIKLPLIKRFYKNHYPGSKPKSDEQVIVALKDREIVGVVRFRMIGQYRLLTGMAVEAQSRQQGIGKQLLDYCQKQWLNPATFCLLIPISNISISKAILFKLHLMLYPPSSIYSLSVTRDLVRISFRCNIKRSNVKNGRHF